MPRTSARPRPVLTREERRHLEQLARSRTAPRRDVQRAVVLLGFADGREISEVARAAGVSRTSAYKSIDKAVAMGPKAGLADSYHRPHPPLITPEAAAWCVSVACLNPRDLGYTAELWSRQSLATHVRAHAVEAGHPSLARAAKATVHRILAARPQHPERDRYYMKERDPEFDTKPRRVLAVYHEVFLSEEAPADGCRMVTASLDETPGVQAIAKTAPASRDHDSRRLGSLSILTTLDLDDGHVLARVEPRDRSRERELTALLEDLDRYYPSGCTIRVFLDSKAARFSKESRFYLATRPSRFVYVNTLEHSSWLNLAETLFEKMAHTFLRHLRATSVGELTDRIRKGIAEVNAAPVVHRWRKLEAPVDTSIL